MHPIAGTCGRTGNDEIDKENADALLEDAKENAEHVMLVDLARNDLSRQCSDVSVVHFREVQYYSHVIHLVSEVKGKVEKGSNPFELLAVTFPAGTLSGAPKIRAMELISGYEPTARSYYGGCIGFVGFDGSCTQAIMIRSLLSRRNTLTYQAGAGIVAASKPQSELEEVNHKLGALKRAIVTGRKNLILIMKILVFDNYDSFTYNLVHLVEKIIGEKVDVFRNDQIPLEDVTGYDKIILSPGPGLPSEAGLLLPLIKQYAAIQIHTGCLSGSSGHRGSFWWKAGESFESVSWSGKSRYILYRTKNR